MKRFLNVIAFSFIAINSFAADSIVTNDSPPLKKSGSISALLRKCSKRCKRCKNWIASNLDLSFTNAEAQSALRAVFESAIVDPSFGLGWDRGACSDSCGPLTAMSAVNSFVATNGWNMQTNDCIFDCISDDDNQTKSKPVRGLPWTAIHEQEFPAVTHDGNLLFSSGVSTTTDTGWLTIRKANHFAATIDSFEAYRPALVCLGI